MHDVLLSDIRIAPTKNLDVNNNSYVVVKGSLYFGALHHFAESHYTLKFYGVSLLWM